MSTRPTPRQRLRSIVLRMLVLASLAGLLVLNNYYGVGYTGVDRTGANPRITAHVVLWTGKIVVRNVSNATLNSADAPGKWYPIVPDGWYIVSGHGVTPSDWYGFLIGNGAMRNLAVIRLWHIWWVIAAIAVLLIVRDALAIRRELRAVTNRICLRCGYPLKGISGKCPECGNDLVTAS